MPDTPPAAAPPAPILATGFVVDTAAEGTIYPSAGGNSADARVQAHYWRCLTVLYASARIVDPSLAPVLFTNAEPPRIDGVEVGALLDTFGVAVRRLPLTHRLPAGRARSWGNVLYFLDILDALAGEPDDGVLILVDSDVVVQRPLDALVERIRQVGTVGYDVGTRPASTVNGMSPMQMAEAAQAMFGGDPGSAVSHFGGELLGLRMDAAKAWRPVFADMFDRMARAQGIFAHASTEEHMFSIAFGGAGRPVAGSEGLIRRIWTSPRHNTVMAGDGALALWHLPAEKRYGLADLYADIVAGRIAPGMDAGDLRSLTARRCGIPRKTAGKVVRDGVRQVAAKLGLRA